MLVGWVWRIVAMVLTSGLIVATRGWEAAKPCIIKGHVYSQLQWYGYLLQKTFHTQTAKVQYQLSFPLRECCANLLIYYDDQVRDLKAEMTCSERESLLPKSNNQIVPLGVGPNSHGCSLHNTSDGPIVICIGERTFESSDPRTWYFALSRCESSTSLSLWYYFNITGFYGDCEADPLSRNLIPPKVESKSYLYLSIALGAVAGVAMLLAAAFFVLWCFGRRRDSGKYNQKPVPNNQNHHQMNQQQQQQQQNHHQLDNNQHQQQQLQQHSTLSQQQFQLQQHQTQLQLQHLQHQQQHQQQQQQQQQLEQFDSDIQPQGTCPLGAPPIVSAVAVSSQGDPPREIYFVNSTGPEQCVNTSDYSRSSSENDYEVIPDGSKSGGDTTDRKQLSVPRKGRHRQHNHSQGHHHHSHHNPHNPHTLQNTNPSAASTSAQNIPLQNIGVGNQVANCTIGSPFIPPLPNHRTFPSQGLHGPNMAFGNNYVPHSEFDNYRMNLYNANAAAAAAAAGNKLIGIPNASATPYHVHNLNLGMSNANITVNPFSGLKVNQQNQANSGLVGAYGLASNPDGINVTNFRPIDPPSPPRSPPRSQSFSPLQGAISNSHIIPNTSMSAMSIGRHISPNPRMGSTARMSRDYKSFNSSEIPLLDECMMPPPPPAPPYPMQSLGTQAMIPSPPSSRYNSDSTDPLTRSSETST